MSSLRWSDVRRWPSPIAGERWDRALGLVSGFAAVTASAILLTALDRGAAPVAAGFEANRGQVEAGVGFLSRGDGFVLALAPSEARLVPACPAHRCPPIRVRLVGARASARLMPQDPLPGSTYASVLYDDVYPGIGLRFAGHGGDVRYTFLVDRGATPQAIVLELDGVDRLELGDDGALVAAGAGARLALPAPSARQLAGAKEIPVEARYVVRGRQIGIAVGAYDIRLPLSVAGGQLRLIDPHVAEARRH